MAADLSGGPRPGSAAIQDPEDGDARLFGRPIQRFSSRAHSVPEIERELARIWSAPTVTPAVAAPGERHVAARTSVLNLVVVGGRPEIGEHCANTVALMAGRHPSRSLILATADPDGPSWMNAQIEAQCVMPQAGQGEMCAEMIYVTAGGDTGRHLAAIVAPLLIHDLPVVLWMPGDPILRSRQASELLRSADRLVVDGSGWSGSGLDRLLDLAQLGRRGRLAISDFGLVRQARWREAIASAYDPPELRTSLRSIRSIAIDYATHDGSDPGHDTNVVKPVYHVAWLASRLGMSVLEPLGRVAGGGWTARLRRRRGTVDVALRPVASELPRGTTLRLEIVARHGGIDLRGEVTAAAQEVRVRIFRDGKPHLARSFLAPRQREVELLAQAIEESGPDPVAVDAIQVAAELAGGRAAVAHGEGGRP